MDKGASDLKKILPAGSAKKAHSDVFFHDRKAAKSLE
jgi:hypothetical protein